MVRRDITQLAVYEIEEEIEELPLSCLYTLYLQKTSEIVYITKDKRLYGIVCQQEALYANTHNNHVKINKIFTKLIGYNIVKAHRIFARKAYIHKIPVVNESNELLGDYSRWDDMLYIERNENQFMSMKKECSGALEEYSFIYVVKPVMDKFSCYMRLISYLDFFKIQYEVLHKYQIAEKLTEESCFIFGDEDERRGAACLYGITPCLWDGRGHNLYKYDIWEKDSKRFKLMTFKSLINLTIEKNQLEQIRIKKPDNLYCDDIDSKAAVLLSDLNIRGVKCFCLHLYDLHDRNELSLYGSNFQKQMTERIKKYPISIKEPWPKRNENENFYGELYENEDYVKGDAQREIDGILNLNYRKNETGKYCNGIHGRRITCDQPKESEGTIYLFGACTILGRFVEDQYTIASFLQKKLLENGYMYRVENCGDMIRSPYAIDEKLEEIGQLYTSDIIIYMTVPNKFVPNLPSLSLEKIYEKNKIPSTWVTDNYGHCNHKANRVIADEILNMIEIYLSKKTGIKRKEVSFSIHKEMKEYIQCQYIRYYFDDFRGKKYATIGSIVMEYDPFDIEHRYMIEQAKQQVDFLIIFVTEDNIYHSCLFSFEERFMLVAEGIKDLDNVMVVPSGSFVFSGIIYPNYLARIESSIAMYSEYDANIFADYIAKILHITHCFIEKEPENSNVRIHNEVMKKILSQKGIEVVEISRLLEDDEDHTSKITRYLNNEQYCMAFELLPETTKQYCKMQINLTNRV